ncbi:hypothetical protein [Paenibacillus lignilyticus]|uniref:Uncharacterized protein n=1 Tax=Paenibacillus lignilyticus TaxID=1172615 RepID=A0ABS5CJ69_9BACL|nr:hypothetical protein [Paenibacillus lignilyticus]MBP3965859.1 hypothetical protein [Paenibacillus lignilyticus]
MRSWFKAEDKASRYKVVFDKPPRQEPDDNVVDGPIIGNGDVRVVVSGEPERQRYWISRNDLWKPKRMLPGGSSCLFGGMDILIPALKDSSYYCEQQLYEGEMLSIFTSKSTIVTMRAWVAAMDNVLIVELSCEGQPVSVGTELWAQSCHGSHTQQGLANRVDWISRQYSGWDPDCSTQSSLAVHALTDTGNAFMLREKRPAIIVLSALTSSDTENCLNGAIRSVARASRSSIASLREVHNQWWSAFWAQSAMEIEDMLLDRLWHGSHYTTAQFEHLRAGGAFLVSGV